MVGLVLVSHSLPLAEALRTTLLKLYGDNVPPLAVAAGAGDDHQELGTDATAISAAVEEVGAVADGVLILIDLGSAIMSAEMALEFVDEALRARTQLCAAPLVEGAIAAAAQCSIGAPLAAVRAEAENALRQKIEHLQPVEAAADPVVAAPTQDGTSETFLVSNAHGLHARPAMRIVLAMARFAGDVEIENLRTQRPPASARSLVAINCLDVRAGDSIRVTARGADAAAVLAAFGALQAENFGDPVEAPAGEEPQAAPAMAEPAGDDSQRGICGKALSGGKASGPLFIVARQAPILPPANAPTRPDVEAARLRQALGAVQARLGEEAEALAGRSSAAGGAILEAHAMLAQDPSLVARADALIRDEGLPATHAWQRACAEAADNYRALDEPLLQERALDVEDIALRVLSELGVAAPLRLDLPKENAVLAVSTLLPSEVAAFDWSKVCGLLAESIGTTSHAAILLRGLGVAAVDGVDLTRLHSASAAGSWAALDGETGQVWVGSAEDVARRSEIVPGVSRDDNGADDDQPTSPLVTRDGRRVELAANVTSVAEAAAASRAGAEAIGLLRTEFLFFDRADPPTEEEQADGLARIADALPADAPITIRTFDIGGDKPVPYVPAPPEANPFLGERGIRLALRYRELFLTHLRAILRAGHGRRFRVMFPMVTEVAEVRQARKLLDLAAAGLKETGIPFARPAEVGMMIEVPAAALNAQSFVADVDFFSIGTNDLTQYTLAAERGHPRLADFADAAHPAVLQLVARVASVAGRHGKWSGICGEAGADPVAGPLFVALGVNELSVGAGSVRRVARRISGLDVGAVRKLARRCLRAESAEEVRRLWAPAG